MRRERMIGMAVGFCANIYIWQGSGLMHWLERATGVPSQHPGTVAADSLPVVRPHRQRDHVCCRL